MLRTGKYEPHVLSAIQVNLQANDVFWDVGSNVGFHSISIRQLYPDISIYAFEPNPIIFSRLWANISLNSQQIKIFNFGLAAESGFAELSIKTLGNSGLSSFVPLQEIDYDQKFSCPVFSGDELILNKIALPPNIIKIDVEGFEFSVFKGMTNALKSNKLRAIIFEARGFKEESELAELLTGLGFSTFTPLYSDLDWIATRPT
jgi:FkbM family methyltransferase